MSSYYIYTNRVKNCFVQENIMWSFEVLAIITSMFSHWKERIASKIVKIWFFFGKILVYLWNIDFPKKVSHSKEFPMFGIIVTLESFRNSVGVSHWNIFEIFMETYRQSFSIHFGVFLENVWNLVGMFGYIGSMRTAKHLEKLWKLDGNYIRQFLGSW